MRLLIVLLLALAAIAIVMRRRERAIPARPGWYADEWPWREPWGDL